MEVRGRGGTITVCGCVQTNVCKDGRVGERRRGGKACDRPLAVHPPQDGGRGPVPSDRQPGRHTLPGRWR